LYTLLTLFNVYFSSLKILFVNIFEFGFMLAKLQTTVKRFKTFNAIRDKLSQVFINTYTELGDYFSFCM